MTTRLPPRGDRGFSLVEMLVVVVIIGVLASIAVPVFLRQRESGWRAAVESDIKSAVTAIEHGATRHSGEYWFAAGFDENSAVLAAGGFNGSPDVEFVVTATDTEFTVTGQHVRLANAPLTAVYDSAAGTITWS